MSAGTELNDEREEREGEARVLYPYTLSSGECFCLPITYRN